MLLQDVTEERRQAREIREAQQSLDIALKAAGMGVWDLDLTTMNAHTSRRHDEIFGHMEPLAGWGPDALRQHIVPEDRQAMDEAYERALETGEFNLAVRVAWPDGSIHWIQDLGRVYHDDEGHPIRMAGVTREVTEQKRAEETLRLAKEAAERGEQGEEPVPLHHEPRAAHPLERGDRARRS